MDMFTGSSRERCSFQSFSTLIYGRPEQGIPMYSCCNLTLFEPITMDFIGTYTYYQATFTSVLLFPVFFFHHRNRNLKRMVVLVPLHDGHQPCLTEPINYDGVRQGSSWCQSFYWTKQRRMLCFFPFFFYGICNKGSIIFFSCRIS